MENVLEIVQVLIAVAVIFLVLLHSGKDAGLSGAFGIGGGGGGGVGGSLVERNLDRWTIFFVAPLRPQHHRPAEDLMPRGPLALCALLAGRLRRPDAG